MVLENKNLALRDYQKIGVKFLLNKDKAFLADDMGLGKTIQVLNAMEKLFALDKIKSSIIILPNGLITNWQKEISKWTTFTSVVVVEGTKNNREAKYLLPYKIKLVSYDSISADWKYILNSKLSFDVLVLDEAQRIKNARTKIHMACSIVNSKKKWLMTGTPLENNISELINLLKFIQPSLELDEEFDSFDEILNELDGIILRRTKQEVLTELPDKLDQTVYLRMNKIEKESYSSYLEIYKKMAQNDVKKNIFAYITKLKQLCNFPDNSNKSTKIEFIQNLLFEEGNKKPKIIVFSQYVETLKKIAIELEDNVDEIHLYHGSMSKDERDKTIESFQNTSNSSIILISLKAGSVGLNLQSATHVILFDRWWNPAVEEQAISRAHRMGRKEPLSVYRFIMTDSIEEKIEQLLDEKKKLIDRVDEKAEKFTIKITDELVDYILD